MVFAGEGGAMRAGEREEFYGPTWRVKLSDGALGGELAGRPGRAAAAVGAPGVAGAAGGCAGAVCDITRTAAIPPTADDGDSSYT